jgi:hypothetical protein
VSDADPLARVNDKWGPSLLVVSQAMLPRAAEGGVASCRSGAYRAPHLSCCIWRKEQVVPVLVIFRSQGDPGDLLALYDRTVADATALSPVRPEAHYCVPTDSGIMIVDVWASDLQRAITETQDFQAKWSAAGFPAETVEVFELHSSGWPVGGDAGPAAGRTRTLSGAECATGSTWLTLVPKAVAGLPAFGFNGRDLAGSALLPWTGDRKPTAQRRK